MPLNSMLYWYKDIRLCLDRHSIWWWIWAWISELDSFFALLIENFHIFMLESCPRMCRSALLWDLGKRKERPLKKELDISCAIYMTLWSTNIATNQEQHRNVHDWVSICWSLSLFFLTFLLISCVFCHGNEVFKFFCRSLKLGKGGSS